MNEMIDPAATPTIPDALPVLPLRNTVIFPLAVVPLVVGKPRTIRLVDDVMRGDRMVALVAQKDSSKEEAGAGDIFPVGTVGGIPPPHRTPRGAVRLVVH